MINSVTQDPNLSLWKAEGLEIPELLQAFHEQLMSNGLVVTVVKWKPKPKPKVEGEI